MPLLVGLYRIMCTLVILRRPDHPWPLLVAGNRDELRERPASSPGRHWQDRPEVVAGLDRLGGGSWLGGNDFGVLASVMNRAGTLGPLPDKRSRGELVLEALDHAEAQQAAAALEALDPRAYRPFNLFVGDPVSAYWLRHAGERIQVFEIGPGLHMLTSADLNDPSDPRIRLCLPRFRNASAPDPEREDWRAWQSLLASRLYPQDQGPRAAMNLDLSAGFGTVSSSVLGVPRHPGFGARCRWWFADGQPDRVAFAPVEW